MELNPQFELQEDFHSFIHFVVHGIHQFSVSFHDVKLAKQSFLHSMIPLVGGGKQVASCFPPRAVSLRFYTIQDGISVRIHRGGEMVLKLVFQMMIR